METFLFVTYVLMIPLFGTSLGAACVFLLRGEMNRRLQRALLGFAAGVMVAASVWSLLLPALAQASALSGRKQSVIPVTLGLWAGFGFFLLLDRIIPHLHVNGREAEGPKSRLKKTSMMLLAVTIHNLPEGMAIGVAAAGYISGTADISAASVFALSLGIAIQNFPEGAVVSLPLAMEGKKKTRSFVKGVLSGIVEPIGAALTVLAAGLTVPALPFLLAFAAGAMLFVVIEELVPERAGEEKCHIGTVCFAAGFSVMMILDTALG